MDTAAVTLDDLWREVPDHELPRLDRAGVIGATPMEKAWQRDGLVILPGLMPDRLIDAYCASYDGGWGIGTPYLLSKELRDLSLYPPLVEALESLIGARMGLHLNLTWWRSTERQWHQDAYLNPPYVNDFYAATWIALADVDPRSGPFQFVRGTHRWPQIQQALMLEALGEDGSDPDWPWRSEQLLTPLFEERFADEGRAVESFVPRQGDVLIWHARLAHRGSRAEVPGMERRALISHYSAIEKRVDMGRWDMHPGGGWYFVSPHA